MGRELPAWDIEDKRQQRHDRREELGLDVLDFIANSGRAAVPKYKRRPGSGIKSASKEGKASSSSS